MIKPDVTKYEALEYWDSQWQIETYADRFAKKAHLSVGVQNKKTRHVERGNGQIEINF